MTSRLDNDDDEGIFYLELPADAKAKLVRLNSGDGSSVSSLALGVGCNSEDTGYSSDQELPSTDHKLKYVNRKKDISDNSGSKNSRRRSTGSEKLCSLIPSSARCEIEKKFRGITAFEKSEPLSLNKTRVNDQALFKEKHLNKQIYLEEDDGVFLSLSDFRSSKTSSLSSTRSDSSITSLENCNYSADKSSPNSKSVNGTTIKHVSPKTNPQVSTRYKTISIDINVNTSRNDWTTDNKYKTDGLNLCELFLGIVPARRDDYDFMGRARSTDVVIKRVLPGSPTSYKPEISVGSVLHSVNDQELTWENMNSLLSSLTKLKKIKLTLKSLRPSSLPVDLETLVNILTSDTSDVHAFDKVAAMYISLEGVDPDSSDNSNDGVVYSFPSEHNCLHQLQGMFYTLSHLVRDINRSNSVKSTTLSLDGQSVHVAYLKEGNDILVFAVPAICATVSELNNLLMEFSRLLRVLYGSIEDAFSQGKHAVFIDNILIYLFRQLLASQGTLSLPSSPLSSSPTSDFKKGSTQTELFQFVRYTHHVQAMSLPEELMAVVGKTLSEFESSNFADMSEHFYGCRRQYGNLGSAFFYCGQLICSHLASEDFHDLQIYLRHLGIFDLMTKSSVTQFVAWKEIFPTRFCQDVAEINNNFGYSEPNARWCWLVVGLKHGLFCSLLETIGPKMLKKNPLSPDVFYVDQAKACVLQLQSPQLLTVFSTRVHIDNQLPVTKSDYCATYVNTTGEKMSRIFSDECRMRITHYSPVTPTHSSRNSTSSDDSVRSRSLYKSPRSGKIYPGESEIQTSISHQTSSPAAFSYMPSLHKLSTSRHPSIYQYCCLDGLEGTVIMGSDMDSAGIFHAQIVQGFYKCCRQIHSSFNSYGNKQSLSVHKDEDSDDSVKSDPHLKGMKEYGVLLTCNPHHNDERHRNKWALEYWVVGRRIKRPSVKEVYVCFNASAPQNMLELAFRINFGVLF